MTEFRLDVLVSPGCFLGSKLDTVLEECPDWTWLLDSGAYTNFTSGKDVVTLDGFAELVTRHHDRVWRYFNLDVIGDHEASMAQFAELRGRGLDPIPVFQRGGTAEQLSELLDGHELVGIGGIAGVLTRTGDRDYLRQVMQVAGTRRDRIHLLGVGVRETISRYRPFSVDSASLGNSRMYGHISLFHDGEMVTFSKSPSQKGKGAYVRPSVGRGRILRSYGLRWEDLGDGEAWRTGGACLVAANVSWIRYSRFIYRTTGTRLFLVDNPRHHDDLRTAWLMEKARLAA